MLPNRCPCCNMQLFYKTLDPFFLLLCSPYIQSNLHLSKLTWAFLSITLFQNFTCLKYELKRFENKTILQSQKSNLVEIMSWYVVDVGVLQPPEVVSAGSPPATRSPCRPGPWSVDLNPRHYSLNKKN